MTTVTARKGYNAAHQGDRYEMAAGQKVEIPSALAKRLEPAGVVTIAIINRDKPDTKPAAKKQAVKKKTPTKKK